MVPDVALPKRNALSAPYFLNKNWISSNLWAIDASMVLFGEVKLSVW
jgi:hypothetical protein